MQAEQEEHKDAGAKKDLHLIENGCYEALQLKPKYELGIY